MSSNHCHVKNVLESGNSWVDWVAQKKIAGEKHSWILNKRTIAGFLIVFKITKVKAFTLKHLTHRHIDSQDCRKQIRGGKAIDHTGFHM